MKHRRLMGLIIAVAGLAATRTVVAQSSVCYTCIGTYIPGSSSAFCTMNSGTAGYENCLSGQDEQGYNSCTLLGLPCSTGGGGGGGGGGGHKYTFLTPTGSVQLASSADERNQSLMTLSEAGGKTLTTCKGVILKRIPSPTAAASIRRETATFSI